MRYRVTFSLLNDLADDDSNHSIDDLEAAELADEAQALMDNGKDGTRLIQQLTTYPGDTRPTFEVLLPA